MQQTKPNPFGIFFWGLDLSAVNFIPRMTSLIKNRSADDLEFCATMSCTNKSEDVWNAKAFNAVEAEVDLRWTWGRVDVR